MGLEYSTLLSVQRTSHSTLTSLREVSRMKVILLVSLLVVNSYQVTKLIIDTDMVNINITINSQALNF